MRSVFYLQEGYMRKIIIILCCVLVFTGCGAALQQNTVKDTEAPSGTEEILPDLSGIEMPDEIPQELTETDLQIMKSIVKVQAGDLYGSGVIYDADEESVLILTAGHVLDQNTGEILVTFPDDIQARAALRAIAVDSDLAFLRVDKTEMDPDGEYLAVTTDRERFDHLEVYEDVWMYGGDNTEPIYAFVVNPWIYVEDFEQYMLLLQGLPEPGMSGGGAFTEDGVFLGILCGADEEGKVAVVPYSIIESERAGLDNP